MMMAAAFATAFAAATASATATTSGLGRKLMKGLQIKARLEKINPAQKAAQEAAQTAQNGSIRIDFFDCEGSLAGLVYITQSMFNFFTHSDETEASVFHFKFRRRKYQNFQKKWLD